MRSNRAWILFCIFICVAAFFLLRRPEPSRDNFGYTPDRKGTLAFLSELEQPYFAEAGSDAIAKAQRRDTFLYRAAIEGFKQRYGREWVCEKQGIGDCVSWSYAHSVWIAASQDWKQGLLAEPPMFPCTEAIYGGSRCEARNKTFAGYSDGSYGGAASRWLRDWGVIWREQHGNLDLRTYSPERAKDWGAYGCGGRDDRGVLDQVAKKHPATHLALVTSFEEAAAAIESGYPVSVCSGIGFVSTRDADGFCRKSGSWAHAMCFTSVRYDRPGLLCQNSWGPSWVSGPRWPDDMPEGSFWVDAKTVDEMLSQWEDSFAVGSISGFKWRDLHHGEWLGEKQ